ncbi:MAG: MFS transporter, partial [Lachnospiraceae bacterium]|nr:MFS transporter [Lachnospiraceae bacterium]
SMVGVLIIICCIRFMKNITDREEADLNILFVSLSSFGFAAFLIGVSNISGGLFSLKSGGLILAGFLLLGTFVVLQLKSENPMLNLRVFGNAGFRIAVILSLCMYLICMGNAMILPIFSKAVRGFSDTAYGLATIVGSILSVITTLSAGRLYDKVGIKPMFFTGTGLFAAYSVMGFLFSQNTSIIYIAVAFAVQTIAMSSLNSPTTAMALSGLEGKERVDGSAIFNTLRQISSSLASTLSVLIYTLIGSNMTAIHGVYVYFGLVTVAIAVSIILYFNGERKK